jgi:adenosylcobinamide-GDP ribazoletransferase
MIKNFLLSLSFISRLPLNINVNDFDRRVKKLPSFFPLVGYIVGSIYYLGALSNNLALKVFFLVLAFYFFDLFHFDGFLDTLDGFLNQSTKEKRLEIMSKGDVGPFAVFFGTLFVVVFWNLYLNANPFYFFISSTFGRYSMVLLMAFSKPAKKEGLGALFFPFEKKNLLISTIFTFFLIVFFKEYIISLTVTLIITYLISKIATSKIGGVTGDVLGGTCLFVNGLILLILEVV